MREEEIDNHENITKHPLCSREHRESQEVHVETLFIDCSYNQLLIQNTVKIGKALPYIERVKIIVILKESNWCHVVVTPRHHYSSGNNTKYLQYVHSLPSYWSCGELDGMCVCGEDNKGGGEGTRT